MRTGAAQDVLDWIDLGSWVADHRAAASLERFLGLPGNYMTLPVDFFWLQKRAIARAVERLGEDMWLSLKVALEGADG